MRDLTWTCMVCGDERPDDRINVHSEQSGLVGVNIRYCNDRPDCAKGASEHSLLDLVRREGDT